MHLCIYASMHLCIYASMHLCIYASMHLCICAFTHLCIYASMHLCIFWRRGSAACVPTPPLFLFVLLAVVSCVFCLLTSTCSFTVWPFLYALFENPQFLGEARCAPQERPTTYVFWRRYMWDEVRCCCCCSVSSIFDWLVFWFTIVLCCCAVGIGLIRDGRFGIRLIPSPLPGIQMILPPPCLSRC